MDLILLLRIIIFLVFCLVGVLVGGLVGNKVGNYKKVDLSKKSVTEECSEEVCPVPKEGDK